MYVKLLLLLLVELVSRIDAQTADPAASTVTKQIFQYLQNQPDDHFIVGQQLGNANNIPAGYVSLVETLYNQTGKYVGLVGTTSNHFINLHLSLHPALLRYFVFFFFFFVNILD